MRHLSVILVCLTLSSTAWALSPNDRVDNFELLDQTGMSHELYYLSDAKAVVLMSHGNGCPVVRDAIPQFKAVRAAYEKQGVAFLMINSNLGDSREAIAKDALELGIDTPILMDETQIIGESLGLERTAEVFVINTSNWQLAYRGSPGELENTLDSLLAGEMVKVAKTQAPGCIIDFPEQARQDEHAQISYAEDIAPILIKNCVSCHRDGGIGPWAMSDYNMVRGFSPMMREVIRTKRMPPWHADPKHGKFSNDRSLSAKEIQTIVHWIEAGSPRGEGPDVLAEYRPEWAEWALGEPDLIIDVPPYDIPATGVVEYQFPTVKNPLDHDVWIRAGEILPGSRATLHHVITRFFIPDPNAKGDQRFGRRGGGGLAGYVPGATGRVYPEDTGTLLPAGATIRFQMHYTPNGKAVTDRSRIGLYFHDQPPKYKLAGTALVNTKILIPAHSKAHTESKSQTMKRDVLLYSLLPHSHFRGIASNFVAYYPDGTEEILLSVPAYDFNWQTSYILAEPKLLPAGTKVVHSTTWDNSAQNPANPDPNRDVPWGQQSWDEMLFGAMSFRYLDEVESDSAVGVAQFQGTAGSE